MRGQSTRVALLSKEQLKEIIVMMRSLFQYYAKLRAQNSLADLIQYPKIPPFLSESLVVHLIRDKVILEGYNPRLGGKKESDIVAETITKDNIKIEVKATGSSAFMMLTDKDCESDYIVWLYFDDFFGSLDKSTINAYIIKPLEVNLKPGRIHFDHTARQKFQVIDLNIIDFLEI